MIDSLVHRLDAAVAGSDVERITGQVKLVLEEFTRNGRGSLDRRCYEPNPQRYARRLVHRDAQRGYSIVAMTWGPGQGTALHDHAGMWCVECVVQGEIDVTQFELTEKQGDRYRFTRQTPVRATTGAAGCLIPPFEYHVISNALPGVAVTLHVYGGEMNHCNTYEPDSTGWWRQTSKDLLFD